ncbi:hypothetical protein DFJ73DRAFT_768222 [Zopfochytrium polystomum]|nr:hypothetical protein DFJ73DRAFT_768222 [Zopfochytrium polystomum]
MGCPHVPRRAATDKAPPSSYVAGWKERAAGGPASGGGDGGDRRWSTTGAGVSGRRLSAGRSSKTGASGLALRRDSSKPYLCSTVPNHTLQFCNSEETESLFTSNCKAELDPSVHHTRCGQGYGTASHPLAFVSKREASGPPTGKLVLPSTVPINFLEVEGSNASPKTLRAAASCSASPTTTPAPIARTAALAPVARRRRQPPPSTRGARPTRAMQRPPEPCASAMRRRKRSRYQREGEEERHLGEEGEEEPGYDGWERPLAVWMSIFPRPTTQRVTEGRKSRSG